MVHFCFIFIFADCYDDATYEDVHHGYFVLRPGNQVQCQMVQDKMEHAFAICGKYPGEDTFPEHVLKFMQDEMTFDY